MTGHSASFSSRSAYLSSDFGLSLAKRYFSDEDIASFGVFSKGKNVGKPRGRIDWVKCESGGYAYSGSYIVVPYERYNITNPVGVERRKGSIVCISLVLSDYAGDELARIGGYIPYDEASYKQALENSIPVYCGLKANPEFSSNYAAFKSAEKIERLERDIERAKHNISHYSYLATLVDKYPKEEIEFNKNHVESLKKSLVLYLAEYETLK